MTNDDQDPNHIEQPRHEMEAEPRSGNGDQEQNGHNEEGEPGVEEEYSLDDLGAAYARAMVESGILPAIAEEPLQADGTDTAPKLAILPTDDDPADASDNESDDDSGGISPLGIVEAALFVGHPENKPLTAAQIAATMRGVSAAEVDQLVNELNTIYASENHAFHIIYRDGGYLFGLSEEMRSVRSAFYGKIRETRLNQAAIDVLALVAYQPGITAVKISEQRGKDSGPIVNQMVRRELLEVHREPSENGKPVPRYYPSARLLNLLGLGSLDDLPQVDEADISQQDVL